MRRGLLAAARAAALLSNSSSSAASISQTSTSSIARSLFASQCSSTPSRRGLLIVAAAKAERRKSITKSASAAAAAAVDAAEAAPTVRKRQTAKAKAKESAATTTTTTTTTTTSTSSSTSSTSTASDLSLAPALCSPLPPPPPIIDLRACLPADPTPFAAVQRWILFSDLHVCDRTVDASIAALAAVRREARRDSSVKTGVAFLGDFWHARGSLPVRPLNAVLDEMARWKDIPLLMLVGNHDQVSAGGREHALEAVAAAAAAAGSPAHVFDRPALFLGALWLPYRRDPAELSAAIAQAAAAEGGGGDASLDPSVVFAHTDVIGAAANDAFQCGKGLEPGAFPVRAWLGHYHRPHVVGGGGGEEAEGAATKKAGGKRKKNSTPVVVEYVGSPYQVSRAEAGQQKALVVLQGLVSDSSSSSSSPNSSTRTFVEPRHDWSEVARVPLDVGPRHFDLRGLEPETPQGLRPGDRVRWILPAGSSPSEADALASSLRASTGADVELHVPPPPAAAPRLAPEEASAGPAAVFRAYADFVGMSEEARMEGEAVLEAVGVSGSSSSGGGASPNNSNISSNGNGVSLSLLSVRVEGFGPFASPAEYDLSAGGVRVLTGRNVDAAGASNGKGGSNSAVDAVSADSNGAGKTSLAMAPHWAITGRSDARADGGGGRGLTHADVVNDGCESASVTVRGTVLGGPEQNFAPVAFELERAVSRKKLLRLRLKVDGEDLTGADARLTQATIDSLLGAPLISRASFLGQADAMSLLEAGDAELKSELSKVALDGEAWDAAKAESSARLRQARARSARAAASLEALRAQASALEQEAEDARAAARGWEEEREREREEREREREEERMSLLSSDSLEFSPSVVASQALRREISGARAISASLGSWLQEAQRRSEQRRQQSLGSSSLSASSSSSSSWQQEQQQQLETAAGGFSSEDSYSDEELYLIEASAGSGGGGGGAGSAGFHAAAQQQQQQQQQTMTTAATTFARQQQHQQQLSRHPVPQPAAFLPTTAPPPAPSSLASQAAALAEQATRAATALGAAEAAAAAALRAAREYSALATQAPSPPPPPQQMQMPPPPPPPPPPHLPPWQQQQWQQQQWQRMQQQQQQQQQQQLQPLRTAAPVCDRCLQPVSRPAFESNLARLRRAAEEAALSRQRVAAAALAAKGRAEAAAAAAEAAAVAALERERAEAFGREAAAREEAEEAELLARVDEAARAATRAVERHSALLLVAGGEGEEKLEEAKLEEEEAAAFFSVRDPSQARELASRAHAAASAVDAAAHALSAARAEEAAAAAAADAAEAAALSESSLANPHSERRSAAERLLASAEEQACSAAEEASLASSAATVAAEVDAAFGAAGARSLALEGALAELQRRTAEHLEVLSPGTALHLSATRAPVSASAASSSLRADQVPRDIERITKTITVRTLAGDSGGNNSSGGTGFASRSLRALSGGERRRVALAFALGFADLAAARGRLSCDLLVLDEVLQHLDDAGCAAVARLLKGMVAAEAAAAAAAAAGEGAADASSTSSSSSSSSLSSSSRGSSRRRTVLVVAQAASFAEREFDAIDVVVKQGGVSRVVSGASVGV